ncbi:MAG: hypothetical protein U0271_22275 [Polyangiaceae bacterium]
MTSVRPPRLAIPRFGSSAELAARLGVADEESLLASIADARRSHLGVCLLGVYVIDDTDVWSVGEIYWFSIPLRVDRSGLARWSPLVGLVTGEPPHACSSRAWMSNISLADPPLLALVPPDDQIAKVVIRFGLYDDDRTAADLPRALVAGLEQLAIIDGAPAPDAIIAPVRQAILDSLIAREDDVLLDQDFTLNRGESTRFGAGFVSSMSSARARVFIVVRDERRTEQVGPKHLVKGQTELLQFSEPVEPGGRLSFFAVGADVSIASFGTLDADMPFLNRTLDPEAAAAQRSGFYVQSNGPADLVAFYTPP